jgi:hypothetical protein
MTPYAEALEWIRLHPGTGSSLGLAKLILSLWNDDYGFSYRECIRAFDPEHDKLAVRIIQHFHQVGENQELIQIGHEICDGYPHLWEISEIANKAKYEYRKAQEAECEREENAEAW